MKKIIAFFVSIWIFFFGSKNLTEVVPAELDTLADKLEKSNSELKRRIYGKIVHQHNNRGNTCKRGKNSRLMRKQNTPSGKTIYHEK